MTILSPLNLLIHPQLDDIYSNTTEHAHANQYELNAASRLFEQTPEHLYHIDLNNTNKASQTNKYYIINQFTENIIPKQQESLSCFHLNIRSLGKNKNRPI